MRKLKLLPVVFAIAVCGCSSNPKTVEVTGTVTYDGKPVEGAIVTFGPTAEDGEAASAKTDASGNFTLSTFEKDDGAIPGKYNVGITKTESVGGMSKDEEHAAVEAGKPVKQAELVAKIPPKYGDPAKSGLTAEVTEGGENHFEFKLTE